jgi:outer membrane protein OmpA-like peptidoglycan-associated protein
LPFPRLRARFWAKLDIQATNDTPDGRQQNRRVDLAVMANDKLKKAAREKG